MSPKRVIRHGRPSPRSAPPRCTACRSCATTCRIPAIIRRVLSCWACLRL